VTGEGFVLYAAKAAGRGCARVLGLAVCMAATPP